MSGGARASIAALRSRRNTVSKTAHSTKISALNAAQPLAASLTVAP